MHLSKHMSWRRRCKPHSPDTSGRLCADTQLCARRALRQLNQQSVHRWSGAAPGPAARNVRIPWTMRRVACQCSMTTRIARLLCPLVSNDGVGTCSTPIRRQAVDSPRPGSTRHSHRQVAPVILQQGPGITVGSALLQRVQSAEPLRSSPERPSRARDSRSLASPLIDRLSRSFAASYWLDEIMYPGGRGDTRYIYLVSLPQPAPKL